MKKKKIIYIYIYILASTRVGGFIWTPWTVSRAAHIASLLVFFRFEMGVLTSW